MSILYKNYRLSPEEYLEGEKYSTTKHEYIKGDVYAMVGVSLAHNLVTNNLNMRLYQHLRGTPCRVFVADVKVRVEKIDAFFYPDLLVSCEREDTHGYYIDRPTLVVEVASPATAKFDEVDKRLAYQTLPSLKEYVLVAQDKPEVRVYRRTEEGWDLEVFTENDAVRLESVRFEIPIADIYEGVGE
jgi:Uma2 family endonuclease